MIPTVYKWELSSLLSYPLGAKNISDAFEGVPQFEELSIRFSPGERNPHRVESPFSVFRVNYSKRKPGHSASNSFIEEGWYDPRWEINVGAVPRQLRHTVKTALLSEALPRVRRWLADHADATGRDGHAWVRIWYNAEEERLSYETSTRLR